MSTAPGQTKGPDDAPAFVEQTALDEPTQDPRPGVSAKKADWIEYAETKGVDSSGTVAEIIARVDEAEKKGEALIQAPQDGDIKPEQAVASQAAETQRQEEEKVRDLTADDNGDGAATEPDEEPTSSDFSDLPLSELPIASQTGDLLLRIEQNKAGIVVLNVSMFGYIGDIPITIPADQADDFVTAVDDLRKQAKKAKKAAK